MRLNIFVKNFDHDFKIRLLYFEPKHLLRVTPHASAKRIYSIALLDYDYQENHEAHSEKLSSLRLLSKGHGVFFHHQAVLGQEDNLVLDIVEL